MTEKELEKLRDEVRTTAKLTVAELFREDAEKHRSFLHATLKTVTWSLGILLAATLAIGSYLLGKSADEAAANQVRRMMREENTLEQMALAMQEE